MEESNRQLSVIRVQSKFVAHLQYLSNNDALLSTIKLNRSENSEPNGDDYVYFNVQFKDGSDHVSMSDLQKHIDSVCTEVDSDKFGNFADNRSCCLSITGEDSCYDSDFEGNDEPQAHDDVSRTSSDTLRQEFEEYVTSATRNQADLAYQSKVEFALKLGYTEQLVQAALQKLGPNPEQNELLAELIKLGAHQRSRSKPKNDLEGCDHGDDFLDKNVTSGGEACKLRPIVIDGSNVAMSHGNKEQFSCLGIKICVDWFRTRGHKEITVFVPKWRKEAPRPDNPIIDQEILHELEKERMLVFTPSREVCGKRMVCYDDRYVLKLAVENDGVVVSNDNYRDLIQECPEFRKVVEERILMYSFVNNRFMPPDDPLGRSGPTLDNFLKMPAFCKGETCPYGRKCTYGNKCKYSHPERGLGPQKSITERLIENAQKQLLARHLDPYSVKKVRGKSLSLPLQSSMSTEEEELASASTVTGCRKQPLTRAKSSTANSKTDMLDSKNSVKGETSPNYHQMLYLTPSHNEMAPSFLSRESVERNLSANLHRKLQRQLSISPTCDPRIYQMQRHMTNMETHCHLPASRHSSYQPPSPDRNYLNAHSNVTRISSAPSIPAPFPCTMSNEHAQGSCSDPQLNLSYQPGSQNVSSYARSPLSPQWPMQISPSIQHNYLMMPQSIEETRRKLHYHLASIFPEEQVDAAMRYYPTETNPQKICAAILAMFSSKP